MTTAQTVRAALIIVLGLTVLALVAYDLTAGRS
jgi:hypothetical protein